MNLIPYDGPVWFPDGLKEILTGKSIEEQLLYFWVFENGSINYTPIFYFSKAFTDYERKRLRHLTEKETENILVKDGVVVGVQRPVFDVRTHSSKPENVLPFRAIYSDYCCENDGAGYKESTSYDILVVLPPDPLREALSAPPFSLTPSACKIPVLEYSENDVVLPDEFLQQIVGKTVAEQLDYFLIQNRETNKKFLIRESDSEYNNTELALNQYGVLLRYSDMVKELYVKDNIIVAVGCKTVWQYQFDDVGLVEHKVDCILKVGCPSVEHGLTLLPVIYK